MGTGYNGWAPYYHSIAENLPELTNKYKFQKGYFGERGTSSQIRVMVCSDQYSESKAFYDKLAYGGIEKPLEKGNGVRTTWLMELLLSIENILVLMALQLLISA